MNCKNIENAVTSYIAGRAGDAERAAVEQHIASCAACRARVAEFRSVWSVLDEAPALEPSPSFDARLRQRTAAEPRRSWLGWLMPSPARSVPSLRLVLATAALALLAVWVGIGPVGEPDDHGQVAGIIGPTDGDLQDYDMLADFDALSALATANGGEQQAPAKDKM